MENVFHNQGLQLNSIWTKSHLFSQAPKYVLSRNASESNGHTLTRFKHRTYTSINPFPSLSPTWTTKLVPSLMHVFIPPKDRWDNAAITFDQCHQLYIKAVAYLPRYSSKLEPIVFFSVFPSVWENLLVADSGNPIQIPSRIYKGLLLQISYGQTHTDPIQDL